MGLETNCTVELNGVQSEGIAHCGDGQIEFKGDYRFRWKWSEIRCEVQEGRLLVDKGDETAVFNLGPLSEKWDIAIKNPKPRLDKLGVKSGMSYAVWGEFDDEFVAEVLERAGPVFDLPHDIVFVQLDTVDDLDRLLEARGSMKIGGAIWAVWAKGRKELTENHIRDFALANGLVDVKVASFSPTLSALKLVIPVAMRG